MTRLRACVLATQALGSSLALACNPVAQQPLAPSEPEVSMTTVPVLEAPLPDVTGPSTAPEQKPVPSKSPTTYDNPILSGFHADPSVCRVGNDYYLATSSFEYFPGVPIYHSRDLVNWRQVGHALTRVSQLPLAGQKSSKGIFAPTLRCHDGTFYLITTNIENGGSFYVTTTDPTAEWSEPVWLHEKTFGMDPSLLFDDDGKVYYTRHGGGRHGAIYQSELDLKQGRLLGEPRLIWSGTGDIWPEGPHLYKVNGYYYLLISEGGTSYEHKLTLARALSPWGPFEADPKNPILTHRYLPESPLQATGHGDLVQTPSGTWWLVLLGIRPVARYHHLGRETLLAPVAWDEKGWLRVNGGQPLTERMTVTGLPQAAPWPAPPLREEFDAPTLALHWSFLREPCADKCSLSKRPGVLRLSGNAHTIDDVAAPAFLGRPQEHMRMRAATEVDFSPTASGQVAGLVLRQDEANHYDLLITRSQHGKGTREVQLRTRVGGKTKVEVSVPVADGPLILSVEAFVDRYEFSVTTRDGTRKAVGSAPTQALSSERTQSFTGVFVGLYASSGGSANAPAADFSWFEYEPLQK